MHTQSVSSFVGILLVALAFGCGGGGGGDVTRVPTLIGSSPGDGATGVEPTAVIALDWKEELDPATVNGNVELQTPLGPVPVVPSYDAAQRRIVVGVDERLALGARYTIRIRPGLATADGRVLAAPYEVAFRTRVGVLQPGQLLETETVDSATLHGVPLNPDGRGFVVWSQIGVGSRTLWATPLDLATGPGTASALGSASYVTAYELGADVNEAGDTVVAWEATGPQRNVMARVYDAGTDTWSPTSQLNTVPGEDCWSARAGIDAEGNALVVWAQETGSGQPDDLWRVRYDAATAWGTSARLEGVSGDAAGAALVVHPDGRACVVWHQESPTVYGIFARRYDPASEWSPVEPLEADDTTRAFRPRVAFEPSGNLLVCWTQEEGAPNSAERIWTNHYTVGSGWKGETPLHSAPSDVNGHRLAMDGRGNAVVAWQDETATESHAYVRRRPVSGVWEDAVPLNEDPATAVDPGTLQVAMNAAGRAILIWARGSGDLESKDIVARGYVPGSGWGGDQALDPAGLGFTPLPTVVLDSFGNALAVWGQGVFDGGGSYLRNDGWCNVLEADRGWQGAALLEDDTVGRAYQFFSYLDRLGRGVVVWRQTRGPTSDSDLYYRLFR